jgi:hypothetical protein
MDEIPSNVHEISGNFMEFHEISGKKSWKFMKFFMKFHQPEFHEISWKSVLTDLIYWLVTYDIDIDLTFLDMHIYDELKSACIESWV